MLSALKVVSVGFIRIAYIILFVFVIAAQGVFAQQPETTTADEFYGQARKFGDAGDYDHSIVYYQKAASDYKKVSQWSGYVKSLNGLGACYTLLSKHEEAQKQLQLALSVGLETLGKQPEVADTYQNLGFDWSRNGDYEKQFENYKAALEIRLDKLGDNHPKVAQTYSSLSVSYKYLGDYENALHCAKKGLDIHLGTLDSNDFGLSQDYTNIGAIYLSKGEYKKAQDYFQRSLDVMSNAVGEQNQFKAIGYSNLGKSYDAQGYYGKAIEAYQNALDLLIGLFGENHVYAGIFYNNLGSAWLHNGNATKAITYHKKALTIFLSALQDNHPYVAVTYINLGNCFGKIKDGTKAISYFQKGLDIQKKVLGLNHPEVANTCNIIGSYYVSVKDWKQALSSFQQGLTAVVKDFKSEDIYSNPNLTEIGSKKNLLALLSAKAMALQAKYLHDTHPEVSDLESSLATYGKALELIDILKSEITSAMSKQELIEKAMPVYERAIEVAFELFKINRDKDLLKQAFEYSEASKAFILLQQLRDSEIKQYGAIPDSIIKQERTLKIRSAFYEEQLYSAIQKKDSVKTKLYREKLFQARLDFEAIKNNVEAQYARYYQLKYSADVFSVEDIQSKLLDQNSVLLEFFIAEDNLYLFSITKDDFRTFIIEKTETYKKLIGDYRQGLTNQQAVLEAGRESKQAFINAAFELYQMLLQKPLQELNRPLKKIIVIPDGELSYLNFEAFLTKLPADLNGFRYKDLDYLIKKYSLSYTYSSRFLMTSVKVAQLKAKESDVLRFGGFASEYTEPFSLFPVGEDGEAGADTLDWNIAALPGAKKEVQTIAEKFDGEAVWSPMTTEKAFKETAHNYKILHLAVHGLTDDVNPMFSKLMFTQKKNSLEDGFLNASEIYNLELNADLVVLSACDSGFGKINKGEGIMSLSRAFAYAGCSSLVASLWKVSDDTTVHSMVDFYDNLMAGLPIDEALQKGKLNYLQTIENPLYEHPYFWAGFIVHGNTQPLDIQVSGASWYVYAIAVLLVGLIVVLLFGKRKRTTLPLF
ncbi:CHAT domain-containing protein [Seonamhaeicola sp.]|uniref:CHAT domain-containing protein n=1 Tax=Seonamhaeicola sp. TaxID=1912245 RepID=UPI00261D38F9|nr:CHAT domain-containing protein [Seonamhaeicola sp.]